MKVIDGVMGFWLGSLIGTVVHKIMIALCIPIWMQILIGWFMAVGIFFGIRKYRNTQDINMINKCLKFNSLQTILKTTKIKE